MGREVRMVPADWQHPKDERGNYVPLFDGANFEAHVIEWDLTAAKWAEGLRKDYSHDGQWAPIDAKYIGRTYAEWAGKRPRQEAYMPVFAPGTATHLMMYEDCTEGTPISPAFATPEELAQWLTDNEASAFGDQGASYEGWLRVAQGGFAPSMVLDANGARSGVDL